MEYSEKMDLAIEFAAKAHDQQYRKGTNIPYISHSFAVGNLLQQAGCPEDVVIAGYLHDILEDTAVTEVEIADTFGEEVLELVRASSEPDRTLSWERRKSASVLFLQEKASTEICMIACADKLHNIRSIVRDYKREKETIWNRFKRGKAKQSWYYSSIAAVLQERIPDFPLTALFITSVEEVFGIEA